MSPLVVLMLIKAFDSRQMEAYVAENAVARVFIGRQHDAKAQIRDHSNIARAYAALGTAGIDEVNALGYQGGTALWLCRRRESVGRYHGPGTSRLAIPTNQASCGGSPSAADGP